MDYWLKTMISQTVSRSRIKGAFEGLDRNETQVLGEQWAADSPIVVSLVLANLVIAAMIVLLVIYCCCPKLCPKDISDNSTEDLESKTQMQSYQGKIGLDSPPDYNTVVPPTRTSVIGMGLYV